MVHHVKVVEGVAKPAPENGQAAELLTRVFYGLTKDGEEVVTVTLERLSGSTDASVPTTIKSFTAYSTEDTLPHSTVFDDLTGSNLKTALKSAYVRHGPAVFNAPYDSGLSLFQKAVIQNRRDLVDAIMALAVEQKFELAATWKSDGRCENLLKRALSTHSTREVDRAIKVVYSGLIPFCNAAAVMDESFTYLSQRHRALLEAALCDNVLVTELCELRVHEAFLANSGYSERVHIDTCDTFLEWTDQNEARAEERWRFLNREAVEKMERGGNASMQRVSLKFICIEDAAQIGMKGIIRPLLMQEVPERFFEFDVVKWVILYKWVKIWRGRFLRMALLYFTFLVTFTLYACSVAACEALHDDFLWRQTLATALLCPTMLFGFYMLLEEVAQIQTFMDDGRTYFRSSMLGVRYFFASRWNWVDIASCILLLVLIPLFHALSLASPAFDGWLSAFIAIEALLAYAKVWYFAQPFRASGALVLLLNNVAHDCINFLLMAFVVLVGFGLALHVLFREVTSDDPNGTEVHEAFGSLERSLETAFYALLGTVEPEIYRSAGRMSWLTSLTIAVYMMAETVVLLNLLIALMGDTFDRVKMTEQAHFLMGRASFIDACEAALDETEKAKMEREIGKYVRVLEAATDDLQKTEGSWTGRLSAIQRIMRRDMEDRQKLVVAKIEEQNELRASSSAEQQALILAQLKDQEARVMTAVNAKFSEVTRRLDKVDELSRRLDEVLALLLTE